MTRCTFLLALILTVACSGDPTGPGQRPGWADNTSWRGTVTMKSGTVFAATFQLTTARDNPLGFEEWVVTIHQQRFENLATGEVLTGETPEDGYSFGSEALGWVDFGFHKLNAFDPTQVCPLGVRPQDWNVSYAIHTEIAGDGTLQGTVKTSCRFGSGPALDSQPIVMRRI